MVYTVDSWLNDGLIKHYVCIHVHVSTHTCEEFVCVRACACTGWKSMLGAFFSYSPPYLFIYLLGQSLSVKLEFAGWSVLAGCRPRDPPVSLRFPSTRITGVSPWLAFYVNGGEPNLGLHAYQAITLATDLGF